MRYFKYDGPLTDIDALKTQHRILSAEGKKRLRRVKQFHRLGKVVFFAVFAALLFAQLLLLHRFRPESSGIVAIIADGISTVVLGACAVILSTIAGAIAAAPFWSRQQQSEKALTRQLLHQSCGSLRTFYGYREPCLVTKCYRSSDSRFNRHDVCIYTADCELRIAANLNYGFFDSRRDLGCYALRPEEITLRPTHYKDRPALELQAGDLTFLLGQKALPFITKQLQK